MARASSAIVTNPKTPYATSSQAASGPPIPTTSRMIGTMNVKDAKWAVTPTSVSPHSTISRPW